jgi:hypothetical protein
MFWIFALPVSLVILAGAYYIKIPSARRFIDDHTSLGHTLFGSFVHDTVVVEHKSASRPGSSDESAKTAFPGKPDAAMAKAAPTPVPVFSLAKLEQDPSLWPKKVSIKKETTFPAVVDGKVVGSLKAPVGSEANLKLIKDGKVGVEYQGGGAWLAVGDTDLEARVMGGR